MISMVRLSGLVWMNYCCLLDLWIGRASPQEIQERRQMIVEIDERCWAKTSGDAMVLVVKEPYHFASLIRRILSIRSRKVKISESWGGLGQIRVVLLKLLLLQNASSWIHSLEG